MTNSLEWDVGLTAFSEFVEGVLMVAVDRYGASDSTGRTLLPAQPLGLLARPLDPVADPLGTPTIGAGALYFDHGSEGFVMPTTDPRLTAKVPPISKGSTALYSNKSFLVLDGSDENYVVLRQPVSDTTAQVFSMVGKAGEEAIQIRHVTGAGICMDKDGSVTINDKSGSGFIKIDGAGNIVISGILKLAGGAVLGDVAGALPLVTFPTYAAAMTALATALGALAAVPEVIAAGAATACTTAATACGATSAGTTTKVAAS